MVYTMDAFITSVVYWITWYRVICPVKVQPSVTILNPNANQMATSGTTGDWFESKVNNCLIDLAYLAEWEFLGLEIKVFV
jgi:hypothetical protein